MTYKCIKTFTNSVGATYFMGNVIYSHEFNGLRDYEQRNFVLVEEEDFTPMPSFRNDDISSSILPSIFDSNPDPNPPADDFGGFGGGDGGGGGASGDY